MGNEHQKTINYLLFFFTFLVGLVLWGLGEVFISIIKPCPIDSGIRNPLLNGFYFAFLALLTILACLFSEKNIHSIVGKEFFEEVVFTPSLKQILPAAFGMMLLAAGVLEFIYEIEPNPNNKETVVVRENRGVEDFYFVIDDSGSLNMNDPENIRQGVLNNLIDGMSEDKRISLIVFGYNDYARKLQDLSPANDRGKKEFREHVSRFNSSGPTTDILTALGLNEKLVDKGTTRPAMVILITDGEHTDNGPKVPTPQYLVETYLRLKIPVYSIFLGSGVTEKAIAFLESISIPTGGKVVLVEDMDDFRQELTRVVSIKRPESGSDIKIEPRRDLLEERTGKRQNSMGYALLRIAFITLIGLLMGYLLYMTFSNRRTFIPLLMGGGISGLLAGMVLEFGLQFGILPDYIIRLIACVILSTIFWVISFLVGWVIKLRTNSAPFVFLNSGKDQRNTLMDDESEKKPLNSRLDNEKDKQENSSGVLK